MLNVTPSLDAHAHCTTQNATYNIVILGFISINVQGVFLQRVLRGLQLPERGLGPQRRSQPRPGASGGQLPQLHLPRQPAVTVTRIMRLFD